MERAKYKAIDVANWFIRRNEKDIEKGNLNSEKLTLLKLLKLLYYAEGCYLALNDKSLFDEDIVAWEHGPVIEEVYYEFPNAYDLSKPKDKNIKYTNIEDDDAEILEEVFEVFGEYSAWGLRNKTHNEKPWQEATNCGQYLNKKISRETMKKFFKENYITE